MDLASLLGGIRPLTASDLPRKEMALRAAYSNIESTDTIAFEQFLTALPEVVAGACFGGDAEDFYLTSLLATASWAEPQLDAVAGAVLNHIVLQLNFMTRFMASADGPESVVLDGDPRLFPVAMANGNVVPGCQIAAEEGCLPAWTSNSQVAKFNIGALRWVSLPEVPATLANIGRPRIGCLYTETSRSSGLNFQAKYGSLENNISEDTFYVVAGDSVSISECMRQLSRRYPSAKISTRFYYQEIHMQFECRGIIVVTGISELPKLELNGEVRSNFQLTGRSAARTATDPIYYSDEAGNQHEIVHIKPPLELLSRTPIPEEARRRISDNQLFPHSVTVMTGGTVVPSESQFCSTFLHVTPDGEVIDDVGEAHNYINTPTFSSSVADVSGQRSGRLEIGDIIDVSGAAMLLTFTPGLHGFFSHFLLQCFPRIKLLRDLNIDASVIVDADIKPKQLEMLARVGVGADRIIFRPPGVSVRADELIVPRPWPLVFSPYTLEIYDELIATAGKGSDFPNRKILISRDYRTTWRTMLTYPSIARMLVERYGFDEVRPERLSLDDEIHLYRDARILIGAEGAGLYGACYGRAGSTYVSIADEDYVMPVIGSAATVRGFDIAYIFGESLRADADVTRRLSVGHSDYVVDPIAVADLVERLI
jgi:hypothetical protein